MSRTVLHPCARCGRETDHELELDGYPNVVHVYRCTVCGTEHRVA